MKRKPNETDHEFLSRTLVELLDHYPAALILVQLEDDSAMIVAGGSSDSQDDVAGVVESSKQRDELIAAAPGVIKLWAEDRGIVSDDEEIH